MEPNTIGGNIRRMRLSRGLTQEEVAAAVDISIAGFRNYESGRAIPKVNTLMAIAKELSADLNDLVSEPRRLKAVRFRAHKKLQVRDRVLIDVANWLDDFAQMEEITGCKVEWRLPQVSACTPELMAAEVREALDIGDQPIRDICGLLESCGIKMLSRPTNSEGFFGLSIGPEDSGPAIVVNTGERISVERWIFSAAHEFGHLLLHADSFDVDKKEEIDEQETEANQFASFFLMPRDIFNREWKESFGLTLIDRVCKIKRIFRVSYRTVLYRLCEQGQPDVWAHFNANYKRRYGRSLSGKDEPRPLHASEYNRTENYRKIVEDKASNEPKRLDGVDFAEDRFSGMVRLALERELITRDRAAEALRLTPEEMIERIQGWAA